MGNKGLADVNSHADFYSWLRLGLVPLLFTPWEHGVAEGLEGDPAFAGAVASQNLGSPQPLF